MKKNYYRLFLLLFISGFYQFGFSQLNIKVKVEKIAVTGTFDCDAGASDNSDFLFEFRAQDNSPMVYSNNSPVAGSIGNCNYAVVNENNGPYIATPTVTNGAVFSPTTGVFFDRNYNCKKDIPTMLTFTWRGYENDAASAPSITPIASGITGIQVNTFTVPLANGTYTNQYTALSLDGSCPQTYNIVFSVIRSYGSFSPLTIANASGSAICTGSTTGQLEALVAGGSGTVLYDWSNDGTGDFDDNTSLVNLGAGTYTIVVKDALMCTDTVVSVITSVNAPVPLVGFTTSTATVCTQQSGVLYSVTTQSNVVYNWSYSGSGAVLSGSTQSVSVNYLNFATSGILSVYAQNSCSVTPTLSMAITVVQTPTVTITGNTSMCNNTQQVLSASGATSYTWTNVGAVSTSITVSPAVNTVYIVNGITNGCLTSSQFTVSVLPTPTVQINGPGLAVCPNQTVALTANGNGSLFIWSDGFFGTNHTVSSPVTNVLTVTNTFTNTCYSQATYTLLVNPSPTLSVSGTTVVCAGKTLSLTVSGANTYTWSNGPVTPSITYTPTALTTLTITGTNTVTGCKNTGTVSVNSYPAGLVAITGTSTICSGTSHVYTVMGSDFYLWNNGATANTNTIIATGPTTVGVVGTTVNGCKDSTLFALNVISTPTVIISGQDSICSGQSAFLVANAGGFTTSYSWSTGATTASINVTPAMTFTYHVTAYNGVCSGSSSHQVVVKPIPFISFPMAAQLCDNSGIYTFMATPAGGVYSGTSVSGNTFDPSVGVGSYPITYQVTGTNGCMASVVKNLVVVECLGIDEKESEYFMTIYPNPVSTDVTVKSDKLIKSILLYDYTGKLIRQIDTNTNLERIDVSSLPQGIYTLTVLMDGNNHHRTLKLVKQ